MQKNSHTPHSLHVPTYFANADDLPEARFSFDDSPVRRQEYSDTLLAAMPRVDRSQLARTIVLAGGVGALLSTLLTITRP